MSRDSRLESSPFRAGRFKNQGSDTLLQMLHSGHGWLAFLIPSKERANMLSVLLHQALVLPMAPTNSSADGLAGGGRTH